MHRRAAIRGGPGQPDIIDSTMKPADSWRSAGQFVTRYEMANQVHGTLWVPVTYMVANSSSYAYPDPARTG